MGTLCFTRNAHNKTPADIQRAFCCKRLIVGLAGFLDVCSLKSFGTLGDVKRNSIAFSE